MLRIERTVAPELVRNPELIDRRKIGVVFFSSLNTILYTGVGIGAGMVADDCLNGSRDFSSICSNSLGREFLSFKETGALYIAISAVCSVVAVAHVVFAVCFLRER